MLKFLFAVTMIIFAVGCDQKSDSPKQSTTFNNQYGMRDGTCYDYTNNVYVNNSNCNNSAYGNNYGSNQNYVYQNGGCYTRSGAQVSLENCAIYDDGYDDGYYGGGGYYQNQKQCYGLYIYTGAGYMQYGNCYGINCRGYTLIEVATGQTVQCM